MSEDGSGDCPAGRRRTAGYPASQAAPQDEDPKRRRRVLGGSVAVEVEDRRRDADPPGGEPEALDLHRWGLLAAAAARSEGVRRPAELGLAFVDEAEIADLAAKWLRSDHPTDVLAFPVEPGAPRATRSIPQGGPPLLIGDVVVCPRVASRQASQARRSLADELALLIVHGVLHLFGYDHVRPVESWRMKRRTRVLLGKLHRRSRPGAAPPPIAPSPAG